MISCQRITVVACLGPKPPVPLRTPSKLLSSGGILASGIPDRTEGDLQIRIFFYLSPPPCSDDQIMSINSMKEHLATRSHLQHYLMNVIAFYGELRLSSLEVMLQAHTELLSVSDYFNEHAMAIRSWRRTRISGL